MLVCSFVFFRACGKCVVYFVTIVMLHTSSHHCCALSPPCFAGCELAVPALDQFTAHVSVVPMLGLSIYLAYIASNLCTKNRQVRVVRREFCIKLLIFIIQLLYPGLSTRIFSIWSCRAIPMSDTTVVLLQDDFNVVCHEGIHATFVAMAVVFMVLFVFGFPSLVLLILLKNKKALHDPTHVNYKAVNYEYGPLFLQYEQKYFWYEVVVILMKMISKLSKFFLDVVYVVVYNSTLGMCFLICGKLED